MGKKKSLWAACYYSLDKCLLDKVSRMQTCHYRFFCQMMAKKHRFGVFWVLFYELLFFQGFWLRHWKAFFFLIYFFLFYYSYQISLRSSLIRIRDAIVSSGSVYPHSLVSYLYSFPPALDLNLCCRNESLSRWLLILFFSIWIFLVLQKWL